MAPVSAVVVPRSSRPVIWCLDRDLVDMRPGPPKRRRRGLTAGRATAPAASPRAPTGRRPGRADRARAPGTRRGRPHRRRDRPPACRRPRPPDPLHRRRRRQRATTRRRSPTGRGATVVRHDRSEGLGAAVRDGLRAAVAGGAAVVAFCDADGEYDPAELAVARRADPRRAGRLRGRVAVPGLDRPHAPPPPPREPRCSPWRCASSPENRSPTARAATGPCRHGRRPRPASPTTTTTPRC